MPVVSGGPVAWLVSGRGAEGLAGQAARLAAWAATRQDLAPADVAWSLATTRPALEHRAVITGAGREELLAGLAAVAAGQPASGVVAGAAGPDGAGRVVFVFPGQGGQWIGMGAELARCCPVFAARLTECGRALAPYVDWDLAEVIAGAPGLDRVDVVQPVLWAVMVSLAAVWEAAGVSPDAVVGHSQGEIAAATVAGILTLEDGAAAVALRSRALRVLAGRGAMASVAERADQVRERLAAWGERVSVAAVNGPAATVVSGEPGAVAELAARCEAAGVRAKVLPVDYASHGVQVERLREEILGALDGIAPGAAGVPMVSAVTGEFLAGREAGAGYWYESLRAPVEFARAVGVLAGQGHRVFVEVSPHPVLTAAVTETLEEVGLVAAVVTGTLRRDEGGPSRLLASLAEVHVRGVKVDWAAVLPAGQRVGLPTYAFRHQRFWPPSAGVWPQGRCCWGWGRLVIRCWARRWSWPGGGLVLTGRLSLAAQPWLADHVVAGTVLVPGTAFVELAIFAGDPAGCGRLAELALEAPLVLDGRAAMQLQVSVGGADDRGQRAVEIYARPEGAAGEGGWTRHASGCWLGAGRPRGRGGAGGMAAGGCGAGGCEGFYPGLAAAGYGYGPAFRGCGRRGCGGRRSSRRWRCRRRRRWRRGCSGSTRRCSMRRCTRPGWPGAAVKAAGCCCRGRGGCRCTRRVRRCCGCGCRGGAGGVLSLAAADEAGAPVVSVASLVMRPVAAGQLAAAGTGGGMPCSRVEWIPFPVADGGRVSWR